MLILKMRPGERVFANLPDGQGLIFKLVELELNGAKVGFIAPASVKILREKLLGEQPTQPSTRPSEQRQKTQRQKTQRQKRRKSE